MSRAAIAHLLSASDVFNPAGVPVRYYDLTATNTAVDAATTVAEVETAVAPFGTAYGLTLFLPTTADGYTTAGGALEPNGVSWEAFTAADLPLVKTNIKGILDEFAKYPTAFMLATVLVELGLLKNPTFNSDGRPVTAASLFGGVALVVSNYFTDTSYVKEITQHEFGHCIEESVTGWETEWATHNPSGFVYGSTQPSFSGTHPVGFVSDYARYTIYEDVAETHQFMIANELHLTGQAMVDSDFRIRAKVGQLRTMLGTLDPLAGAVNFYRDATMGPSALSAPSFTVFGDSMAAGGGAPLAADKWFTVLADLMQSHAGNRPVVYPYGVGGSRLGTHAQLQGGAKIRFTVSGGQIPTSGAVIVTPEDPELDLAESPTGTAAIPGFVLAGVAGTIRRPGGRNADPITFTRDVTGTAVPAAGWQTLTHTPGETHRAKALLYWGPHNNRADSLTKYPDHRVAPLATAPYVVNTMAAMGAYNTDPADKWAVLGLTSGPTVPERIGGNPANAYDPDFLEIFGTTGTGGATADIIATVGAAHWIDVRAGLISLSTDPTVSAYARAGITPTADDIDAAGAGKRYPGPSLRPLSDGVGHLNAAGQAWVSYRVFEHMKTYAWFTA